MEEFITFLMQQGIIIQLLDNHHILLGYQGRWEVLVKGDLDNKDIFKDIWDMLLRAYGAEPHLPDDFIGFSEENGYYNIAAAWTDWQADKVCSSKLKVLLAEDYPLFAEEALKVGSI